jgi:hypothetical protein
LQGEDKEDWMCPFEVGRGTGSQKEHQLDSEALEAQQSWQQFPNELGDNLHPIGWAKEGEGRRGRKTLSHLGATLRHTQGHHLVNLLGKEGDIATTLIGGKTPRWM